MPKRPPQNRQPRGISPDLTTQPTYRAGMYAELQKFKKDKTKQLLLFDAGAGVEAVEEPKIHGLEDLTVSQDKALSALQILLDKTGYKGHGSAEPIRSEAFKWEGVLPKLSITYSDYFEAYGLRKISGRYQGAQTQEAIEALESLTQPRRIVYSRRKWKGDGKARKVLYDVIVTTKPLISLTKGYKDLEAPEASRVIEGEDLPAERVTRLIIEASPLLVDNIETFYLLKPAGLHREIEALYPGKRVPRAISLFVSWLLTKNDRRVKASKDTLIEQLRLEGYIKRRRRKEAEEKLQEAFQRAKELSYLLEYEEDGLGSVTFQLNPQRCRRIGSKEA